MSTGLLLSMLSKELQGVSGQAQPPRMGPGPSVSPRQALQSVGETCGDDGGAGWGGGVKATAAAAPGKRSSSPALLTGHGSRERKRPLPKAPAL